MTGTVTVTLSLDEAAIITSRLADLAWKLRRDAGKVSEQFSPSLKQHLANEAANLDAVANHVRDAVFNRCVPPPPLKSAFQLFDDMAARQA